jgi:hypothetical protein
MHNGRTFADDTRVLAAKSESMKIKSDRLDQGERKVVTKVARRVVRMSRARGSGLNFQDGIRTSGTEFEVRGSFVRRRRVSGWGDASSSLEERLWRGPPSNLRLGLSLLPSL